jgi:hypothetical protein
MKMRMLALAAIIFTTASAQAWVSTNPKDQLYSFKFHMKGETYEYQQSANTYEEAFSNAAKACFSHFKAGRHLSEDDGLDIIDVCANPRST